MFLTFALIHIALISTVQCAEPLKLIAHRGGVVDEDRIENSIPAIEEAVRRGYWMLEVDIQESRDGHLVVHHDADFKRFYGDDRRLVEMSWKDIARLRSNPGGLRPLQFHELAAACKGKVRLMVDTKGPHHSKAFYEAMERALRDNQLLETAYFIGTAESKAHFADKARTAVNRQELRQAVESGQDVRQRYFLFEHGRQLDEATVKLANRLGVPVVVSINVFHYPQDQHLELAADDCRRVRRLGVTKFQIDSVYDKLLH